MPSTPIVVTLDYLTMLYPEFADETPDRIAALGLILNEVMVKLRSTGDFS